MKRVFIEKADYVNDLTVRLQFNDGVVRDIDFSRFLKTRPHPQRNKYIKYANFKKFRIANGNIVWGKHEDLVFDEYKLYKGINPS